MSNRNFNYFAVLRILQLKCSFERTDFGACYTTCTVGKCLIHIFISQMLKHVSLIFEVMQNNVLISTYTSTHAHARTHTRAHAHIFAVNLYLMGQLKRYFVRKTQYCGFRNYVRVFL